MLVFDCFRQYIGSTDMAIPHENISSPRRERADIVNPNRLQAFSDAVFATAATFLVIPVRKFELLEGETLKQALIRQYPQLLVFVIGYLVVCAIWESHIIRFKLITKVDDVIVSLTLISLMVTTFLPFSIELEGNFGLFETPIILNCMLLLSLEILEAIMFFYAFKSPKLLNRKLRELEPSDFAVKRKQIYMKLFFNCCLFVTAALFSMASVVVSWVLITTVILSGYIRKMMSKLNSMFQCCPQASSTTYDVLSSRISKERIEAFSDAAIAIVALLLILDLTTEEFPTEETVEKKGIKRTLHDMWQLFVAYIGTYVTVATLWFVHHSVLHHIKVFTAAMVILNNIFLTFLAGSPFISTLVNKFTGTSSHNEKIAVRVSCIIVFVASVSNLGLYLSAIYHKNIALHSWAVPSMQWNNATRSHAYLLLKTLVIPLTSLITFLFSLGSEFMTFVVYHISLVLVPILFIVLKILYACHCVGERGDDIERSSSFSESYEEDIFQGEQTNNAVNSRADSNQENGDDN